MNEKKAKKVTYLKLQMTIAIFLLTVAFISGFFIFGPELTKIAKALSGNYSKGASDQLTATEWNNLAVDFLDKESVTGDSMAGPLILPADPTNPLEAATKQYVDSIGGAKDISGNPVQVVCGQTRPGSTAWQQWGISEVTIFVNIDTSAAGFTSEPIYISNMGGTGNHFMTLGTQSVYNTTASGFTVYITKTTTPNTALTNLMVDTLTPAMANSWGWHIHWCGVGN